MVTGLPGTGKSRLAAALAAGLGAPLFAKDLVKEALFDTLGSGDAAWSRRLSDAAFAVLFALARSELARGAPLLLLEGNFRAAEHEPALRGCFAPGTPVRVAQVQCRCDPALRRERLRERAAEARRHPGHRDAEAWQALDAAARQDASGFLELAGPQLVYDSSHPDGAATGTLLAQLGAWCG